MIHFGTLDSLYKKHEREFTHLVLNKKPLTHSQLSLSYVDSIGKKYYAFPKEISLPLERAGKLQEFMQYISKGLTAQEDESIDDAIAKALLSQPTKEKIAIAIGAILAEKQKRRNLAIHTQLFYDYMAVQLIREDENPETFDNEKHMQKVDQFKADTKEGGTYFFFQKPPFKKLFDLLNFSITEWETYWHDSLNQQKILKELMAIYSTSPITLTNAGTTSTIK